MWCGVVWTRVVTCRAQVFFGYSSFSVLRCVLPLYRLLHLHLNCMPYAIWGIQNDAPTYVSIRSFTSRPASRRVILKLDSPKTNHMTRRLRTSTLSPRGLRTELLLLYSEGNLEGGEAFVPNLIFFGAARRPHVQP